MLKLLTILFCAASFAPPLFAEQEFVIRQSISQQFIVYGPKASPIRRFQSQRVPLDAALVAVSCERIKQALLAELGGPGYWQLNSQNQGEGKIYAVLHPKTTQSVVITPVPTSASLNYRIDLPNQIEALDFVEAVTETVLLEMVNRHSTDKLTQIPRWLTEGLAAQVLSRMPDALVLEQRRPFSVKARIDPIAEIRHGAMKKEARLALLERSGKDSNECALFLALLRGNFSPLTFDELSWPEILTSEKAAHYGESAHLFVYELLRLRNGDAGMRKMLETLPEHPNWQIAFMRGFESYFSKLVDVEKWWELSVVNLTGRDSEQLFSREQSMEQVDAALQVPVQTMQDFSTPPTRSNLTLQEIVVGWKPDQQKLALQKVVNQLNVLQLRVQPETASLLDEYRALLENYLHADEKNSGLKKLFTRDHHAESRQSTRDRLDALDKQRAALRNKPRPSTRDEAIRSALEVTSQAPVASSNPR